MVTASSEKTEKPKAPRAKQKADPKFVAAARELRDRWLERVNAEPRLIGSAIGSPTRLTGKYKVTRAIRSDHAAIDQPAFGAPRRPVLAA